MESSSKYSVNRIPVFSGLADHWRYSNRSLFSLSSLLSSLLSPLHSSPDPLPVLALSSCLLMLIRFSWRCVPYVLKGSSSVRYPSVLFALTCTLAKEVQLFPGLGLYSGIFAIYLQCQSRESRTAIIVFYVLCLLYILSAATVLIDLLNLILDVSNNSLRKNIIFYQLCRHVSLHYHLNFKLSHI